jgi:hypothetical protein
MKKTFPLTQPKLHPDRVLDALKHEIRKYLKRERGKPLAEGVEFLDFDCRFGLTEDSAETIPLADLMTQIDAAATSGATHVYVELLAKPGQRPLRPATADADGDAPAPVDAQTPQSPAADGNDGQTQPG